MITLYHKPACPFCHKVFDAIKEKGIEVEMKDITEDAQAASELEDLGGKMQVPFLLDTDRQKMMYESEDIIAYLDEHYAAPTTSAATAKVRIHRPDAGTCVACEG